MSQALNRSNIDDDVQHIELRELMDLPAVVVVVAVIDRVETLVGWVVLVTPAVSIAIQQSDRMFPTFALLTGRGAR